MSAPGSDPIRERRASAARFAVVGKRVGYSLFLVAIVAFFAGAIAGFSTPYVTIVVVCIAVGSVFLAPAIVIGYGVRAAEREDHAR